MKPKELRKKPNKELRKLMIEFQGKLGKIKFELNNKKIKNCKEIKTLKRDIARIKTLLKEKKNE